MELQNMEKSATNRSSKHIVAMPFPGRGHINPMLNLCNLILCNSKSLEFDSSSHKNIIITLVVTEEWLSFLQSELELKPLPPNLRLAALPQVIPSEIGRAAYPPGYFYEAVLTKLQPPFEELLDRLEPPATTIIYDTYLSWVVGVANRRNISLAALFTMSASVFSVFSHFDLLLQHGHFPVDISERGQEIVDYIPGLPSTTVADLTGFFHGDGRKILNRVLEAVSSVHKAQHLLLTSIPEYEGQVTNCLKEKVQMPIYQIGPLIPYLDLMMMNDIDMTSGIKSANGNDQSDYYFKWLDSQPEGSVLYISQGSFRSVSSAQMKEIVAGIKESGVHYLWITRGDSSNKFMTNSDMGLSVPWCEQLKVLCHPSVGGFWTHCGWNSTMEAVYAGVPMLTCPISSDQIPNCKLIVDDWKIGWRVMKNVHSTMGKPVSRQVITQLVRKFMDPKCEERLEMVKRIKSLQDILTRATRNGGSASSDLDAFIKNIL